jgi:exopolysaccharide production protein ExoZ
MKLQSIQALRGIAALLVVIYHARALESAGIALAGGTEPALIGGLFASGFAGVDLFFVVSGFVMVWVTRDTAPSPAASADFLFARTTRIYPVWWVAATLGLVYMVLSGGVALFDSSGKAIAPDTPQFLYLVKSYLLVPQAEYPVLLIGWTLIHEIYFYLVFALILCLPRRLLPYALLVWGISIVAASLLGLPAPIATDLLTLVVHPMTMEFIFGAMVGLVVTSGLHWRPGIILMIAVLWLIAALGLQGEPTPYTLQWGRVLEIGLPCALLIYAAASLEVQGRLAWLIPALIGAAVAALIFQLYGLTPSSPLAMRQSAVILAVLVGAAAMLVTFWTGWLLGQTAPDWLRRSASAWRGLYDGFARTGDWSYSIYLFHLFALGILQRLLVRIDPESGALAPLRLGAEGSADNLLFLAAGTLAAILAGWLGYRVIERPSIFVFQMLRRKLFRRAI